MNIERIHLLVHPGYHRNFDDKGATNAQKRLFKKWDKRVQEVAQNNEDVFVYVSDLSTEELQGDNYSFLRHRDEERARIQRYQELLGERFVLINNDPYDITSATIFREGTSFLAQEHAREIHRVLKQRDFTLTPHTELDYFGEYITECVPDWGNELIRELHILPANAHLHTELSLDNRPLRERISLPLGLGKRK